MWAAIGAVFESWNNDRAVTYRKLNNIPGDWGTAVTVQSMVFGNLGADCATGVAFTRDPSTGAKGIYGEFLPNAQGEDVVAGIRTPRQISLAAGRRMGQARRHQRRRAQREARHAGGKLSCGVPRAGESRGSAGAPFPRHAGPRIHHRARQTLHASDAQRQTHSRGRGSCGGRDDPGKAHRSRHRAAARRAGATRTIAPPATRSARAQKSAGARPAGVARRRRRRSRIQRRRGSRGDSGWAQGNPGSHRDFARGHPRDAGGGGNSDRAWRDDQPCRGGGARDGQVLRGRMLGNRDQLRGRHAQRRRQGDSSRRIPDARRHRRRGYRGTRADRRSR